MPDFKRQLKIIGRKKVFSGKKESLKNKFTIIVYNAIENNKSIVDFDGFFSEPETTLRTLGTSVYMVKTDPCFAAKFRGL